MAHGRKLMGNPKVGDGIRIAAGVYLIYLAYQILKDGIIGGEMTGRSYAAGIIFSILFIVGGAGIAAFSVRHLMRLRKEEGQQKALQDKAATETGETTEFAEASEVPEEELEMMKQLVKETMEHALELSVPLKASLAYGPTWYEAK